MATFTVIPRGEVCGNCGTELGDSDICCPNCRVAILPPRTIEVGRTSKDGKEQVSPAADTCPQCHGPVVEGACLNPECPGSREVTAIS